MDGSDMYTVSLFARLFVVQDLSPVHLKEETDWLDGFEAWEAEDGSDMNCCVSLFALLFVVVEDAFLFASPQKKNGVPKRECSIVSWTLLF
jgi:hypothetical protein